MLEKLITAVKPAALKEHNNIANFAKEKIGIEHLQAWDINFATEKYKEYIINFEEDSLQDYFYLPNVLNGLFDLLYKFYDLKFERDNEVDTWDSYVQFYRVYNNNQLLGGIYFDLFERSNKDPGSWMTEAQHRRQYKDGSYQPTISFITCDFEHPTSPEAPVLLHHSEIIILFH